MHHSFVLHRKSRCKSVPMKNCLKFGKSKRNTSRKCSNKRVPVIRVGGGDFLSRVRFRNRSCFRHKPNLLTD